MHMREVGLITQIVSEQGVKTQSSSSSIRDTGCIYIHLSICIYVFELRGKARFMRLHKGQGSHIILQSTALR